MRGFDYVLKRLAFALVTVFVAVTLNFVLFRALPGDAVTNLSRLPHATEAVKQAVAREFGLDKSKWQQYVIYLRQLTHFNLGISYQNDQPVSSNLRTALGNTIPMVTLGTLFAIVFGMLTGVIAAWRRGTALEKGTMTSALAFYSMPTHWLALMLIILFAGTFPTRGMVDPFLADTGWWPHTVDVLRHMSLPALTLGLTLYGEYTVIVRSAMLETLGEDYVLTARAKGLSNWATVWRHGLRNALLPIVTLVALSLGFIIGGSITIEYVFSYPGIGLEVVEAIDQRDYPILQGAFLLLTLSVIFANLVADLLYFKLDPRVTT
jgi:ABC-type dipeptide/oligopeptide/nickel transport system permease component